GEARPRARMIVRKAHASTEPGQLRHTPLWPGAQPQGMVHNDWCPREDRVTAAAVGLDHVRPAPCEPAANDTAGVTRRERRALLGARGAGEQRWPPRRDLLQQRSVPIPR